MAGKILATSMLWDIKKIYQCPTDSGITDVKMIINTYSKDTVKVYTVWAPGWALVWWELQWSATWVAVTEEEKKQRAICVKELQQYERLVDDWLLIWDEDQIWWEAETWVANIVLFGDINSAWAEIEDLKTKVLLWTATAADKEKLMLLTWWAYQINNNTNNCSCP